jgi:glycerol-3-phosphate dehydrogenase
VDYLLRSTQPFFPELRARDIFWTNAGVRALVRKPGSESSVSRLHRIIDGRATGAPSLVSVAGGKITGYRAIAEEAVDMVCRKLGIAKPCVTAVTPLPDPAVGATEVSKLAASDPALAERLAPQYPDIAAQVIFAIRQEQCVHLSDFLLRRTLLGFTPDQGLAAVPAVAALMSRELKWSPARTASEVEDYRRWVKETTYEKDTRQCA